MSSYFFAAMKTKIWQKLKKILVQLAPTLRASLEFRGFMKEIFYISHCPPLWCTQIIVIKINWVVIIMD